MDFLKKLPTPEELAKLYPLSKGMVKKKQQFDKEIKKVFSGESNKLLLNIGPCSADRMDAVLEYTARLSEIQKEVVGNILIVPRVYTSKPRTVGKGYMGMIHQPYVGQGEDLALGVVAVRNVHRQVVEETGMFPSDELLYPEIVHYVADLLGYVVIGARSVENQQHRLVASGLNIPAGMKNPISGSINVMLNAIETAQNPHHFIFSGWEVMSKGNEFAHGVLRGYLEEGGAATRNCDYEHLSEICERFANRNVENPAVVVDCNHSNSDKQYMRQIDNALEVLDLMKKDSRIKKLVKGLMIESYLEDGNQPVDGGVYGKSITDPCLGWDKTKKLIYDINEKVEGLK